MKVSNVCNTLTLNKFSGKRKPFSKNWRTENTSFPFKTALSEMLRQIEWQLQNGPITQSEVLPVTTLFFGNFFPRLEPLKKN